MKTTYHLDFETYSEADLRSFGAYRYASDPSTEILIMAIAKEDGQPILWDSVNGGDEAVEMFRDASDPGNTIYAHNAQFEAAVCKYKCLETFGFEAPPLENWRCTAAMARRAAIPASLAQAGAFLGIKQAKDSSGTSLIRKFSIPRKPSAKDPSTRTRPGDDPEAFASFCSYCVQDVLAEQDVHKALAHFELTGSVLASFHFDMRMNDRGVPVNVAALVHTQALIEDYTERLTMQFRAITGLNPTQRAKVMIWMAERGYVATDMTSDSVDAALDSLTSTLTPEAFEALEIRSKISYAAVKKVATMIGAACPDQTVKGSLMWSGAERTHRWAGRIIQPQNFRRPSPGIDSGKAYKMLCDGAGIDEIETEIGSGFLEIVASSIRHFIDWPQGDLLQADFSAVEARGAPWLVGGQPKLDMFRAGAPIYETMAAKIFGVPLGQVISENKAGDSSKRFVGKQAELGCAYNMGPGKFRGTCEGFKFVPTKEMTAKFKSVYRAKLEALNAEAVSLRDAGRGWEDVKSDDRPVKVKGAPFLLKVNHEGLARIAATAAHADGTKARIKHPANPTPDEWSDLTYDNLALRAVGHWRLENPWMVKAWRAMGDAAMAALEAGTEFYNRGGGDFAEEFTVGSDHGANRIRFTYHKFSEHHSALIMLLPGGHELHYPNAKIGFRPKTEEQIAAEKARGYEFSGKEIQFSGKQLGRWSEKCSTYGGKLLENATQAICGDFMAHGAITAEKAGYKAFMLVHDELIGPALPGQDHKTLCDLLSTLPDWADGMELDAEGAKIPYYKK